MRALPLFEDRWVGVARDDHPVLDNRVTLKRYGAAGHIQILRRGLHSSEVDDAAAAAGAQRRVGIIVNGFAAAIALCRDTDLIATVPERHTEGLRRGVSTFALPFDIAGFTISMLWHPRMDGDLGHRWLRSCLRTACGWRKHR
jgi:DNA-binding transcriptional LysR family regulator